MARIQAYRQEARREIRSEKVRKRKMDDTNAKPDKGNSSLYREPRSSIPSRCLFRENDWTRFRVSCSPPLFRPSRSSTPACFCPLESCQLSPETRPISISFAVGDTSLPFPPTFSRSIPGSQHPHPCSVRSLASSANPSILHEPFKISDSRPNPPFLVAKP